MKKLDILTGIPCLQKAALRVIYFENKPWHFRGQVNVNDGDNKNNNNNSNNEMMNIKIRFI